MDNIIQLSNLTLLIKILSLILVAGYVIFAAVVLTQIRAMNKIIHVPPSSQILIVFGVIHLLLAVSLFVVGAGIL